MTLLYIYLALSFAFGFAAFVYALCNRDEHMAIFPVGIGTAILWPVFVGAVAVCLVIECFESRKWRLK